MSNFRSSFISCSMPSKHTWNYTIYSFRKQIQNGLWPTTWNNLLIAWIFASCVMYIEHPKLNIISDYMWMFGNYIYLDEETYPYFLRLFVISFILSIMYFIVLLYTRQYMLRILLSWKGWLCKYLKLPLISKVPNCVGIERKSGLFYNLFNMFKSNPYGIHAHLFWHGSLSDMKGISSIKYHVLLKIMR